MMTDQQSTGQKLYEVSLDSGESVLVTPLSHYYRQLLDDRARESHPDPDPQQYERPMENALVEGQMLPASENPEYQAALSRARLDQRGAFYRAVVMSGAVFDTPEGRDMTLKRYAGVLAQRRTQAELPEDDWLALVIAVLISTSSDVGRIVNAANDALKEDEIRDGLRCFRRDLQRREHRANTRPKITSRAPAG